MVSYRFEFVCGGLSGCVLERQPAHSARNFSSRFCGEDGIRSTFKKALWESHFEASPKNRTSKKNGLSWTCRNKKNETSDSETVSGVEALESIDIIRPTLVITAL